MPPFDLAPSPPPPTVGRVLSLPSAAAVARGVPAFYREETIFHWLPSPTLPGPPWMPAVIVAERAQMPETWRLKSNFRDRLPQALVVPIWQADLDSGAFECSWMLWLTWDVEFQLWRFWESKSFRILLLLPSPLASPFFRGLPRSARFHLAGTVDADRRFCWWNRVFEPERRLLSPSELVLLKEMQEEKLGKK